MMSDFFGGQDFLNPLDFPNWQPLGAMEAEDMFDFGNIDISDPAEMLPMTPRQFEIQDPAQEAFQFPFQFPMQDPSGGEGRQYAPVDVPENMLQEATATSLLIDETASETNQAMSEQQGLLGSTQLPELMNEVERMTQAQMSNVSANMSEIDYGGAMLGASYPTTEEDFERIAQQMQPPITFSDLRTENDFENLSNVGGQLVGDMSPTDDMIRELAQQNVQEPLSAMEQAQAMFNPTQEQPSEEPIPSTTETMFDITSEEQIKRNQMYDARTYELPEDDSDSMYDPETYGFRKSREFNLNQSLVQNAWEALKQESLTEDWGIFGEILQGINPSQSLVENLLDQMDRNEPRSPVIEQTEGMSKTGADKTATPIVTGKLLEAVGLDGLTKSSLIETLIKLVI